RRDHHHRGPGRAGRGAPPAAGRVRRARRAAVRVLHARADLLGGGHARRGGGGLAERGQRQPDRGDPEDRSGHAGRGRDPGADEREPVPVRRLRQHHRRDHRRGRGGPVRPFGYLTPAGPAAAIAAVTGRPGAAFLAGGTNLVDLMKLGVATPDLLVDVTGLLPDLIEPTAAGGLRIGAGVRNSDLAADPRVRAGYPVLARAVLAGASGQLRNMATVGGNLLQRTRCLYFQDVTKPCNKRVPGSGCPAREGEHHNLAILGWSEQCVATHPSDMAVALVALDAVVHLDGRAGRRSVPLVDLHRLAGDEPQRDTVLEHGELISAVELPPLELARHSRYVKVRERASFAFALLSVAAAL